MAEERDLEPIHFDVDYKEIFDAVLNYCKPEEIQLSVLSSHIAPNGFSIDIIRPYSIVASNYKGTFHLTGVPCDDGSTDVSITAKAKDTDEQLGQVRERIKMGTLRQLDDDKARKALEEANPLTPEQIEARKKKEKITLIVSLAVAVVIFIGILPTGCS